MSHRFRAAHLALLLVALSSPVVAGGVLVDTADAQQRTPSPTERPAPDETTIRIGLQTDGDARWVVTAYFNVTSDQELESFNETAARFTAGETDALGLRAFERAKAAASDATGRQMNITGVERTSSTDPASLSLSFTWTNFARVEGDARYVGDVFNTSEPWLTGLEPNQRLIVELPPGSGIRSGPPKQVESGRIVWEGPTTFERDDLELVYNPGSGTDGDGRSTDGTPGTDGRNSPGNDGGRDPFLWGGFFVVGLGIAVLSVYVLSMRDRRPFDSATPSTDAAGADEQSAGAAAATPDTESGSEDDSLEEELLSDEERVERLLERNGGRMKQANIVKETGWSNAKVSQLLSSMAEEGEIDKLRIGRENLISFPDEDVTDIDEE